MKDQYIAKYRRESPVLNPQPRNVYQTFINPGDADSMSNYLIRLKGGTKKPGQFYNPREGRWEPSKVTQLDDAINAIEEKFQKHKQYMLNSGKRVPTALPPDLVEEKAKIEAKMTILEEEVEFLEREIMEATKKKSKSEETVLPRKKWGSGEFRDGVLANLGGFQISPDKDGILRIDDSRSIHDGMEAWRFREQIYKPMEWEFSHRVRTEKEAAKAENCTINKVPYPEPGIWYRNSDTIEYPGYSYAILKVIKELNDI